MKDLFFHNDADSDVGLFVTSLGDDQYRMLEDLLIVTEHGPSSLGCDEVAPGIWAYERALGQGRRAILLFTFVETCDVYIALHGFRTGTEGTTRGDLRLAQQRRRTYPR